MLKVIIIDDEQESRIGLQIQLQESSIEVEVLQLCASPREGIAAILEHRPDLVFLDIDMPQMSGFELLECVKSLQPRIIFVTAHNKYAIQAFRYSALDYLLKPIDQEELEAALGKAVNVKDTEHRLGQFDLFLDQVKQKVVRPEVIALPVSDGLVFKQVNDILYCKSDRNYTFIFLCNKEKMLVSRSLKEFETLLSDNGFYRVHHSALVNLYHVKKYVRGEGGYVVMADDQAIEVSRQRKEEFMKLLNRV